jgi:hypothetical protein
MDRGRSGTRLSDKRGKLTIICLSWRPLRKNTLVGFAGIEIRELGLKVHDLALHQKGDRTWAALPSRPWIRDGAVVTDDAGKVQYSSIFEFTRSAVRDAFSAAVIRAVCERFPDALALEKAAT